MLHQNRLHFLTNQTPEQMMSFIIETEDDKIIVIDGGAACDMPHLVKTLQDITGEARPTVNAWFFTHAHLDHVGAFISLQNCRPDAVNIEHIYYNLPSRQFMARHDKGMGSWQLDKLLGVLPPLAAVCDTVSVGDSYQVGAARFDILYTYDPAAVAEVYNDSSVVMRMTLAGQTLLFLGDLYKDGGEKLLAMYGAGLASDMVQMAHHGQNGVEKDVYEAIASKACFWCTPDWLWNNDGGKGFDTHVFRTVETRRWMAELGIQRHYVTKNGDYHLTLPIALD